LTATASARRPVPSAARASTSSPRSDRTARANSALRCRTRPGFFASARDDRFLNRRQGLRRAEDCGPAMQRTEQNAQGQREGRCRCQRALLAGPPGPRFHAPVKCYGRDCRRGGLSGAPRAVARTGGSLKWLCRSSSKLIHPGLDQ
jgi:hypothetical protein